MELIETRLEGPLLLQPHVHADARGFFLETYRREDYRAMGVLDEFVQDNHSRSGRGVVRGMHFQVGDGQAKLVACARGAIYDVVVDLRRGSPTFGDWEGFELDDRNQRRLYVPIGFAHGLCATSEVADVYYKCSAYYDPANERGISFADSDIGIQWPRGLELQASERDATAPSLSEIAGELPFRYGG